MDYDALKSALDAAIDPESDGYKKAVANSERFPPELSRPTLTYDLKGRIEKHLSAEPEFKKRFMVNLDNGSVGFQADPVAQKLLSLALDHSSQAAVEWLEKVLATKSATGIAVSVVWGLATTSVIQLTDDLSIVPVSELPDSPQKEAMKHWRLPDTYLGHSPQQYSPLPTTAIVRTVNIDPLLRDLDKDEERRSAADGLVSQTMLKDVRMALTLVSSEPLIESIHWFQFDDPDIQHANLFGGTGSFSHEILPQIFKEGQPLDDDIARSTAKAFLSLSADVKDRILIALARFNQATIRHMPGDKAVELSIALEALLVDDRGEHTHKVGMRAALLAGGTLEERTHNRSIVSALYALRSALMHSGRTPQKTPVKGKGKTESSDVVKDGIDIVRTVISTVVESGEIPDWWKLEVAE